MEAGLIDRIIDRIETVPFLTPKQRRGIYCDNAARFLRLPAELCASPLIH